MEWAKENPGDFHFLWECLRVIFLLFWGHAHEAGSLAHLKSVINRKNVEKEAKHFQASDEFLHHALDSYLIASLTSFLGMETPDQVPPSAPMDITLNWLQEKAHQFVLQVVSVPRDMRQSEIDQTFNRHRSFLHISLLYWDLRNAIRHEDGPSIISHWRWWLVYFLASKRTNYSHEAANLLTNLKTNFSERLAYIVTHNRTVDVSGCPGKGKPIDMAIEHHNLIFKNALRSSGANVTQDHLTTISLASQQLHDAAVLNDTELCTAMNYGSHRATDCKDDLIDMIHLLLDHNVTKKIPGRQLDSRQPFNPPFGVGWEVAIGQQWIKKFLRKTETIADFESSEEEQHNEIESIEQLTHRCIVAKINLQHVQNNTFN